MENNFDFRRKIESFYHLSNMICQQIYPILWDSDPDFAGKVNDLSTWSRVISLLSAAGRGWVVI